MRGSLRRLDQVQPVWITSVLLFERLAFRLGTGEITGGNRLVAGKADRLTRAICIITMLETGEGHKRNVAS
jgi:hypothetical protein